MFHRLVLLAFFLVSILAAQTQTLTNEVVIRMFASGVPTPTILRAIELSDSVYFRFLPADLQQLADYKLPEDVIRAMAARQHGNPAPQVAKSPAATVPPVLPASSQPDKTSAPASRSPLVREYRSYAMRPGTVELGALGGINYAQGTAAGVEPSFGANATFGINRFLAPFAEYEWNSLARESALGVEAKVRFHEVGGGLQASVPNFTRVTPYFVGGVTWIRTTGSVNYLGEDLYSESANTWAFNFGGGSRIHITRNFGLRLDLRCLKGPDTVWIPRLTFGAWWRVN